MKRGVLYSVGIASAIGLSVAAVPAPAKAQWYASGNLGVTWVNDSDVTETGPGVAAAGELTFDTGWSFNGAVGRHFGNFRIEGEISRRQADADTLTLSTVTAGNVLLPVGGTSSVDGEVTTWGFMANGWYDFPTGTAWVPTVGGGIGFANVNMEVNRVGSVATSFDESDMVFAYQFGVGLGYRLNPRMIVGVNYRYFGTTDPEFEVGSFTDEGEYQTHNIEVGLRYRF
jgi:opacity protein-like surface antigen